MKILIIEDEMYSARDLQRTILQAEPQAEILAILPSVEEGIAFFADNPEVDLIFSDIQLNDGLSFEIFGRVNRSIPIIFCTAYNQYALEAFRTYGIDYILKPFADEQVRQALEKYGKLKQQLADPSPTAPSVPDLDAITEAVKARLYPQKIKSLIVHKGDKLIPMPVERIAVFFIDHENVWAYTFSQEKFLLNNAKLDGLEASFAPTFFRVNRQQLVHRKAVRDAAQYFHRKLLVNLTVDFEPEVIVGKLKVKSFLDWLSTN
ncbi:MAG: LytTR family DNA-binding domain-containing protein [Bacteroidota bacterium]